MSSPLSPAAEELKARGNEAFGGKVPRYRPGVAGAGGRWHAWRAPAVLVVAFSGVCMHCSPPVNAAVCGAFPRDSWSFPRRARALLKRAGRVSKRNLAGYVSDSRRADVESTGVMALRLLACCAGQPTVRRAI